MSQYRITLPASRDLETIYDYFATVNIDAGSRFIQKFNQKCQQIARFPNSGRSYDYLRPNLRGLPLNGHIIFYAVIDEGIEIIRVVGGKQNLERLFEIDEES